MRTKKKNIMLQRYSENTDRMDKIMEEEKVKFADIKVIAEE